MSDDHDQPFAEQFVDCAEGRLRVLTAGDAGPPVLLLSGGGIDSATLSWRHLIPALAPSFRVFAPDWPKQGGSRPWHGRADHDRLLRCVTEVLDHFGLHRAALVGISQGGAVALAYAIEHPDRVSRLVALAPAGIIDFPPILHQVLWLTARLPLLNRTLPSLFTRTRAQTAAFARRALFARPPADLEQVVDEILAESAAGSGATDWQNGSIGLLRMRVDLRARLSEIRCPTLFLQGDSDLGVRPRFTREAARLVPGAELVILKDTGHWISRQSPDLVNAMIKDFLSTHSGAA